MTSEETKKPELHLPVLNIKDDPQPLDIAGFDEVETPDADCVSLGSASYTKMLGKIWR